MVIDSSALMAIFQGEPEAPAMMDQIAADTSRLMSAVTALETAIVVESRQGPASGTDFDVFLHQTKIEIVPFTAEQMELARDAFRRFGKGRHPARLNFGDCCSYALSRYSGEPLLFKGGDFAKTDVVAVKY